jgi:hypothetical protein
MADRNPECRGMLPQQSTEQVACSSDIGTRCLPFALSRLPTKHGLARTSGAHAVGCGGKLATELLHQQIMIPTGAAAASYGVASSIERVGLGRGACPNLLLGVERTGCSSARGQKCAADRRFDIWRRGIDIGFSVEMGNRSL